MGTKKEAYLSRRGKPKTGQWLAELRPYTRKRARPFKAEGSALIVVDLQGFFLDENSHAFVPAGPAIVPNTRQLLAAFRKRKQAVFFTRFALKPGEDAGQMGKWWRGSVKEGSPASRITPELRPAKGERVIRKKSYDAFRGTRLEALLRKRKIRRLVVTGVLTHLCCDSLAREAFERGFQVFLPVDALASYTEELHLAALKTLAHGFATPVTTMAAVKVMEGCP